MGCTEIDSTRWKDFPKGLKVLLLEENAHSAAEIRSKLESVGYIVFTFLDEDEALAAVCSDANSFHVAIVEVNAVNSKGCFKFLEKVQFFPTIMISDVNCLSTMMKCIALGAAEFLQKPLSEEKLKNIWQHVVHKAFNAGGSALSKSLKPIKEATVSILNMEQGISPSNNCEDQLKSESPCHACLIEQENQIDPSLTTDNLDVPIIPELERSVCALDDSHIQGQHNWSAHEEKEDNRAPHELNNFSCLNSKSVDITCNSSVCEHASCMENSPPRLDSGENDEEVNSASGTNVVMKDGVTHTAPSSRDQENIEQRAGDPDNKKGASVNASNPKTSKKKMKVDWSPELHKCFVRAVEQLGIEQAIPSKILELMKVEGLTRHNVASHLQKYRIHKRHTMHKLDEAATRTWQHHRGTMQKVLYTNRPIMAFPPPHSNYGMPTPYYPVWGHTPAQPWAHMGFPPIYPPESWPWMKQADTWGCPVFHVQPPTSYFHQKKPSISGQEKLHTEDNGEESWLNFLYICPEEEVIDKAVKEAISKPWLPLPLGLKPPSVDSVLSELHRHGINRIPPFPS